MRHLPPRGLLHQLVQPGVDPHVVPTARLHSLDVRHHVLHGDVALVIGLYLGVHGLQRAVSGYHQGYKCQDARTVNSARNSSSSSTSLSPPYFEHLQFLDGMVLKLHFVKVLNCDLSIRKLPPVPSGSLASSLGPTSGHCVRWSWPPPRPPPRPPPPDRLDNLPAGRLSYIISRFPIPVAATNNSPSAMQL